MPCENDKYADDSAKLLEFSRAWRCPNIVIKLEVEPWKLVDIKPHMMLYQCVLQQAVNFWSYFGESQVKIWSGN